MRTHHTITTATVALAAVTSLAITGCQLTTNHTPASHSPAPTPAVTATDTTPEFDAECGDNGTVLNVTPDNTATRHAAERMCQETHNDANQVASQLGLTPVTGLPQPIRNR